MSELELNVALDLASELGLAGDWGLVVVSVDGCGMVVESVVVSGKLLCADDSDSGG